MKHFPPGFQGKTLMGAEDQLLRMSLNFAPAHLRFAFVQTKTEICTGTIPSWKLATGSA